jgi:hypothetical protein
MVIVLPSSGVARATRAPAMLPTRRQHDRCVKIGRHRLGDNARYGVGPPPAANSTAGVMGHDGIGSVFPGAVDATSPISAQVAVQLRNPTDNPPISPKPPASARRLLAGMFEK